MKANVLIIWGAAVVLLFAGCSTVPVAMAPVGPNPAQLPTASNSGQLEVFSALSGRMEGNNPTWYQHTDYYVCNSRGKELRRVDNSIGHYTQRPRIVTLPPGNYIIEARAKDVLSVEVPVLVKSGEITRVHLDGQWQPISGASKTELVFTPGGYPVGWSAGSGNQKHI
jgi:hypothetical protein